MASDPQLFRVTPESRETHRLDEVEFAALGLREVQDIQEWVAANPSILGNDLLIIAKELSEFDRAKERLDLLAVDFTGALVIIELKRDDSGQDAHWQAIKYASYLRDATPDFIVQRLADYAEIPLDESGERLLRHLGAEELSGLNHDQRIILASHRFAPEVTSAALWLNDKTPGDALITCVTLTPFRDLETDALYVQANTIIPVPTVSQYSVGVLNSTTVRDAARGIDLDEKQRRREARRLASQRRAERQKDDVTHFCWKVADLVLQTLPPEVRPDKTSEWAMGSDNSRYFDLWYSRLPWADDDGYFLHYSIILLPRKDSGQYGVIVGLEAGNDFVQKAVRQAARQNQLQVRTEPETGILSVGKREIDLTDDCAQWVADELCRAITIITPAVDALPVEDAMWEEPDDEDDEEL